MFPGSSGDKPGYVEIFDKKGDSLGRVPVEMLQMVQIGEIEWSSEGIEIPLVGYWDFKQGTCYYWDKATNRKVFVKQP